MTTGNRPSAEEFAPYYEKYISLVTDDDIAAALDRQLTEHLAMLRSIPEDRACVTNEPGKWSVKQIVGHLVDNERVFAYRALRFARNDATPLPGFDENEFMRDAPFDNRPLAELVSEFEHVRKSTIHLFRSLSAEAWLRAGLADEKRVSVRALAYIIAGHERHHMSILRRRYLS
jgi:hypothetical protein